MVGEENAHTRVPAYTRDERPLYNGTAAVDVRSEAGQRLEREEPAHLQGTTVYYPTRPWTLLLNSFEPNANVHEMLIFSVNSRLVAVHDSRLASD